MSRKITSRRIYDPSVVSGQGPGSGPATGNSSLSIEAPDGTIDFEELADDAVVLLAPQIAFPHIKDYCGLIPEVDFSTATEFGPADERGILNSAYSHKISQFGSYPELILDSELRIRSIVEVVNVMGGTGTNIIDYAGSGETVGTNFLFGLSASGENIGVTREFGAGLNRIGSWIVPGRIDEGLYYLFDLRVNASDEATMFVNGLQLRRFASLDGVTDDGDGVMGSFETDGDGSSSLFPWTAIGDGDGTLDVKFIQIYDVADPTISDASEYAEGKRTWTEEELEFLTRDDHASLATDPDAIIILNPGPTGLVDEVGTIASWDTEGDTSLLIGDSYWTETSQWVAPTQAALRPYGDHTIYVHLLVDDSTTLSPILQTDGSGESEDANILNSLSSTDTTFSVFYEHDGGVNANCQWATNETVRTGDIIEWCYTSEDIGGGFCKVRAYERKMNSPDWVQLVVNTSSGTTNGDGSATIRGQTGGDNAANDFVVGEADISFKQVRMYSSVKPPI